MDNMLGLDVSITMPVSVTVTRIINIVLGSTLTSVGLLSLL